MTKNLVVAVDFDGTCLTHVYSANNPDVIGMPINSVEWLKKLSDAGVKIILYTMRHDRHLLAAVMWFVENEIKLWGINENPDQHAWSASRKVYAQLYVDDAALGCPLTTSSISDRPYVNWSVVGPKLMKWAGIKMPRKKTNQPQKLSI